MDVKEINNVANPATVFGRMSSQGSSAVAGQGFAGLIAQVGDLSAELMPSAAESKESGAVLRRASQPKNSGLEKVRSDFRSDNDKNKKEVEKAAVSEKKSSDKKRRVASEDVSATGSEQRIDADNPALKRKDGVENGVVSIGGNNEAVPASPGNEVSVGGDSALGGEELVGVEGMGEVSPQNMVLATDSVKEGGNSSAIIKDSSSLDVVLQEMSAVEGEDAELSPELADMAKQLRSKMDKVADNSSDKASAVIHDVNKVAEVENAVVQNAELEENLGAQSAELAEMLDDKQKLKIEVDVKEEKISYLSGQDLVKNRQALDEALAAVDGGEVDIVSAPTSDVSVSSGLNSNQNAPVVAFSALVSGENVSQNAASASEEGISVSGTQVASAEVVNNGLSGIENGRKSSDVSFRDVYKGMSKEVVEQVKVNITKSAVKGVDTINVRLKPEDLGHIEIKMQIKDGKLQAHIISSRPETAEILQKEAATLEKAFNDAGFQTDGDSLNFSFREDNQANQNKDRNSDLRNFMGEIFENETARDLSAVAGEYEWNGGRGLNIKV